MINLGKYQLIPDLATPSNGDAVVSYLASAAGLLGSTSIASSNHLHVKGASDYQEDAAHVSGDWGNFVLAVRNDTEGSMAGANGDYAPLQVDSLGRLRVNADININNDFVFAEDAAHSSGDLGAHMLAVRQDTLASSTSADGDYASLKSNASGELYVADSTARTSLASILAELQAITHAEDAAHVSGDLGVMSLAVRNDAGTSLVSASGDYSPLSLDANGNLRVSGTVVVNGTFAEDSAHTTGDLGIHTLAVRKDALSTSVSADGDYASLHQWSEGSLKTVDQPNIAALQAGVTVTTTAAALVASSLANRRNLLIQNLGLVAIYVGSATVTPTGATAGIQIPAGGSMPVDIGPNISLFAVTLVGTADVRVLELS